jgi:hypothetical protein
MLIQNQVGPITTTQSVSPGTLAPQRAGNLGDTIVSELHGRYYETTYRRVMFSACAAGVTTTVGLATTFVGICITNPIGSTVNLVLNKFGYAFLGPFAAPAIIGAAFGYNSGTAVTQTTALAPKNNFVGVGASGQGLAASATTLPTAATLQYVFDTVDTGAITTVPTTTQGLIDFEGSLILPAGSYLCSYTSTVSPASNAYFSASWEEVPV